MKKNIFEVTKFLEESYIHLSGKTENDLRQRTENKLDEVSVLPLNIFQEKLIEFFKSIGINEKGDLSIENSKSKYVFKFNINRRDEFDRMRGYRILEVNCYSRLDSGRFFKNGISVNIWFAVHKTRLMPKENVIDRVIFKTVDGTSGNFTYNFVKNAFSKSMFNYRTENHEEYLGQECSIKNLKQLKHLVKVLVTNMTNKSDIDFESIVYDYSKFFGSAFEGLRD